MSASKAAMSITAASGSAVTFLNLLIITEVSPAIPHCNAPNKDAAIPALSSKGAMQSAVALGLMTPIQPSIKKNNVAVPAILNHP